MKIPNIGSDGFILTKNIYKTLINNDLLGPLEENNIDESFQLATPEPNITTLVNPYKPTSPARLFSKEQLFSRIIFIGLTKTLMCSLPCGGQVFPIYKNTTYFFICSNALIQNKETALVYTSTTPLPILKINSLIYFTSTTHYYIEHSMLCVSRFSRPELKT